MIQAKEQNELGFSECEPPATCVTFEYNVIFSRTKL